LIFIDQIEVISSFSCLIGYFIKFYFNSSMYSAPAHPHERGATAIVSTYFHVSKCSLSLYALPCVRSRASEGKAAPILERKGEKIFHAWLILALCLFCARACALLNAYKLANI
jgi:hypothetical protein